METLVDKILESDASTLISRYNSEAIALIEEAVIKNDWRLTGELKPLSVTIFNNSTKSSRKRFRDRLNRVLQKPTLRSINTLRVDIKVKVSEKEECIQIARKKYVEARNLAIKLYKEYKEEKGDYYKNKLAR